jgi:hypothetical protein
MDVVKDIAKTLDDDDVSGKERSRTRVLNIALVILIAINIVLFAIWISSPYKTTEPMTVASLLQQLGPDYMALGPKLQQLGVKERADLYERCAPMNFVLFRQ